MSDKNLNGEKLYDDMINGEMINVLEGSHDNKRITSEQLRPMLQLYLVMGSTNTKGRDPRKVLNDAIAGGVMFFQLREKGEGALQGKERLQLAIDLRDICREAGVPFIINDDVELALDIDADGVHVGQEDEVAEQVRQRIGNKILGVSSHNVEEAKRAIKAGADYLGVGPMYQTDTKKDIRKVKGPCVIGEIRSAGITIPLVGIGGINLEGIAPVIEAGADGVAVISGISYADDPQEMARRMYERVQKSKG